MEIFECESTDENFGAIVFEDERVWDPLLEAFGQTSLKKKWGLPVAINNPEYKKRPYGDTPYLFACNTVLSRKAFHCLKDWLTPTGEFLPFMLEGHKWYLFNTTKLLDCLDKKASEWDGIGENIVKIRRHLFKKATIEASGLSAFKVVGYGAGALFVTERFVARVKECGLEGFVFNPVWQG